MEKKVRRPKSKGQTVSHLYHYTLAHVYGNTHRYLNTSTLDTVLTAWYQRMRHGISHCLASPSLTSTIKEETSSPRRLGKGKDVTGSSLWPHQVRDILSYTNLKHLPPYKT